MKTIDVPGKIAAMLALGVVLLQGTPANSATFLYKAAMTEARYTERPTTVNGITYDGIFENSVFDPFAMRFRQFFGFFSVVEGVLGEAVTVKAVQQSPVDRTALGEAGMTETSYLDILQDVASVPGAVAIPPGLSEFDFKFVPAPIADAPTLVSQGWSVTLVPEPSSAIALGFLGGGLFLAKKGRYLGKFVKF